VAGTGLNAEKVCSGLPARTLGQSSTHTVSSTAEQKDTKKRTGNKAVPHGQSPPAHTCKITVHRGIKEMDGRSGHPFIRGLIFPRSTLSNARGPRGGQCTRT